MATSLEQAIACIKAGDIEKGKQFLADVIRQNPRDENAWLWMTRCVATVEQKKYCFERVLKINPQNQHAITGLKRLTNPVSSPPPKETVIQPQPVKKKKRLGTWVAVIGMGLVLAFLFFCVLPLLGIIIPGGSYTPAPTEDYSGGATAAYVMCKQFIEKRLVAPATAKWPSMAKVQVLPIRDKKDAFQAKGYVDSQNRMSALIRTYYVCEVSYLGNDQWHLDYLNFDE